MVGMVPFLIGDAVKGAAAYFGPVRSAHAESPDASKTHSTLTAEAQCTKRRIASGESGNIGSP